MKYYILDLKRPESCLEFLTLEEIYYLWQLAGGDIITGMQQINLFNLNLERIRIIKYSHHSKINLILTNIKF